ncbi:MAG: dTDP-4-dehydrorhamnose reductase [Hyphomicrobiales bacterium]|nr:dTDP-4-dehydrorhamnose reductase [Hyphomicrobiales bacterium]
MTRALITGAAGQVGGALVRMGWPSGWTAVGVGRAELDLADAAAIRAFVLGGAFDVVINCAAYTAVDRAESDPVAAWTVNALAPAALAAASAAARIPIVQVSTDYVFAGDGATPHRPTDPIAPLGVYGASKAGGELAVRTANPRHAIVRTSWVVSATGANFVKTMLRLAGERDRLRVVDDQWGAPTSAVDLAAALAVVARRLVEDPAAPAGVWHFAQAGETTWCRLAREVFRLSAARGGPSAEVEAIGGADYPTSARRPANSRLSLAEIEADFGLAPRDWRIAIEEIVAELISPGGEGAR